jgi:multiple sugar transport system substrate-binding protein
MAAVAGGGAVPFAACGTRQPAAPASGAKAPAALRFVYRAGQEAAFEPYVQLFVQQSPQVKVTTESYAGAEYFTKLSVLFAGGTPGDLTWVSSTEAYFDYVVRDRWLGVDALVKRDKVDLKQWFAGSVEMLKVGGALYALPLWSHPGAVGLYYNKEVLAAQGVPAPDGAWTFDKALEHAQRLTRRTGGADGDAYGYLPATLFQNGLGQVVAAFGGTPTPAAGKTLQLQTPQAQAAAQWLADLAFRHQVAPPPGTNTNTVWSSGRLAMRIGIYSLRLTARAQPWPINWGVNLSPKGAGGTGADLRTDSTPIAKTTPAPDAAWELHRFLSGAEIGLRLARDGFTPGARPDVWTHPELTVDETHRPFIAVMQSAPPLAVRAANGRLLELFKEVDEAMAPVWRGEVTAAAGLADAQRRGQLILDLPAPGRD